MSEQNKEQQYFDNLSIIEQSTRDVIGVSRTIFDMTEDWHQAQILAELVYWTSPSKENKSKLKVVKDGYRWLACSRIEWWERRRLKPREVDRAIIGLIKKGLVVKALYFFNGLTTIHLRINITNYIEQLLTIARRNYSDTDLAITNESEELLEAMRIMGWDKINGTDLPNGESPLPNGKSINSNIHSKLPIETKPKKLTAKELSQADQQVRDMIEHSRKASSRSDTLLPEQYQDFAKAFIDATGLTYIPNQKSKWIGAFEVWNNIGVSVEDIKDAAAQLSNYTITSPMSMTNTLNGMMAKRKLAAENDPYKNFNWID